MQNLNIPRLYYQTQNKTLALTAIGPRASTVSGKNKARQICKESWAVVNNYFVKHRFRNGVARPRLWEPNLSAPEKGKIISIYKYPSSNHLSLCKFVKQTLFFKLKQKLSILNQKLVSFNYQIFILNQQHSHPVFYGAL